MPFPNLTEPELDRIVRDLRGLGLRDVDRATVRGVATDFFGCGRPTTVAPDRWATIALEIERAMRARRTGVH